MVTIDDVLACMSPCEPYTAGELAEQLEATRRTVDRRLRELNDTGRIQKKKHSKRRVTWWVPVDE